MKIKNLTLLALLVGGSIVSAHAQCTAIPAGRPPGCQKPWIWQGKIWNWNGFEYVTGPTPVYNKWGSAPGRARPGPGPRKSGPIIGPRAGTLPAGSGHIRYTTHHRINPIGRGRCGRVW